MPKEKEVCLLTSIIAFTLTVCCVVWNPQSNEIKCTEESVKKIYCFLGMYYQLFISDGDNLVYSFHQYQYFIL